jgi:hypothetical protein
MHSIKSSEIAALCAAAAETWKKAPPGSQSVHFTFKSQTYVARRTQFQMIVETAHGEPIASCRL